VNETTPDILAARARGGYAGKVFEIGDTGELFTSVTAGGGR
jgi:hypothetical protein